MTNKKSGFNSTVSLCRVIGMLMIVICHVGTAVGSAAIGQLFQSGVQLFLLISGFLYANKQIDCEKKWFAARFMRINIPCYLWIAAMCVVGIIMRAGVPLIMLVLSIVDLQGYFHLITFLPHVNTLPGASHLWFITALMLCYLLTIFFKRYEASHEKDAAYTKWLAAALVLCVLLGFVGIQLSYVWIYFAGYAIGKKKEPVSLRRYAAVVVVTVAAMAARLLVKRYCDVQGDNNFYLYVVIPLAYNAMAICLFYTIDLLNHKLGIMDRIDGTVVGKTVQRLDALSFYVYITHYAFTDAPFSVINLTGSMVLDIFLLAALTAVCSIILEKVTLWVTKMVQKR